jgi:putative sterol carrier protein
MSRSTRSQTRTESGADAFLTDLADRGAEPLLKHASGTIRVDLTDGDRVEHRMITIDDGDVSVSRRKGKADATLRVRPETFDGMASGRVNAIAAVLRGEVVPEGDLGLVVLFQRVFPSPPRPQTPAATTGRSRS